MEEDPQLCIEDMLANPMEGLPPVTATPDALLDAGTAQKILGQERSPISRRFLMVNDGGDA